MIKQTYTARELAELKLDGLPHTRQGIEMLSKREGWHSQPRQGRGGGREFPFATLPQELQEAIILKFYGRNESWLHQMLNKADDAWRARKAREMAHSPEVMAAIRHVTRPLHAALWILAVAQIVHVLWGAA